MVKFLKEGGFLPFTTGILMLVAVSHTTAQITELEPQLQDHIRAALTDNLDLDSWTERVTASEKRISQAGAWQDPMLTVGLMNLPVNSFDFNQEPMTGAWITLSQSIPLTDRYSTQRDIATLSTERVETELLVRQFDIAGSIGEAWYDWTFYRAAVATLDSTIEVLDQFLQIAGSKYETGSGLLQDLFKIETEQARLLDKRAVLAQMAKTTGERVAILLGRDPLDVPPAPGSIPQQFTPLTDIGLDSLLIKDSPTLASTRTGLEITRRQLDLKKSLRWPNLNLNAGYGYRQDAADGMSRPDFFSLTAGISIPVFGSAKQGAAVEEAAAVSRERQSQLNNQLLQLRFALQALLDEDLRLDEQITIYSSNLLPLATATVSASISTYSVNKTDIEALLMAQTALFNSRLELIDRLRDRAKTRVRIAALVGSSELILRDE